MSSSNAVYIERLKDHVGQEVTLKGWLYNSRASGKVQFLGKLKEKLKVSGTFLGARATKALDDIFIRVYTVVYI